MYLWQRFLGDKTLLWWSGKNCESNIFLCMTAVAPTKTINRMMALQLRTAGSNVLFAAIAEISDSVLKGAETSGFDGLVQISLSFWTSSCIIFLLILHLKTEEITIIDFLADIYNQGKWISPRSTEIGNGAIIVGDCFDGRWPRSKHQAGSNTWDWWGNKCYACKLKDITERRNKTECLNIIVKLAKKSREQWWAQKYNLE